MKLGIFMGSFNPPHKGHIDVVNYLLAHQYVDNVLIVPTLNYWNKQNLIDIAHRINMLRYFENEHIKVDTQNNHHIYTIELIHALEKRYPKDELYLIIGADNLVQFDKWKNYKELLKYKIIVMNRDDLDITSYIKKLGSNNFIIIHDYPFIKISSTNIRNTFENKYLDSRVINYIKENDLYGRK